MGLLVSLEAIVSTTEGYLHDKILEQEVEMNELKNEIAESRRMSSSPGSKTSVEPQDWKLASSNRLILDARDHAYDDSFDEESDDAPLSARLNATVATIASEYTPIETPRSVGYPD